MKTIGQEAAEKLDDWSITTHNFHFGIKNLPHLAAIIDKIVAERGQQGEPWTVGHVHCIVLDGQGNQVGVAATNGSAKRIVAAHNATL